MSRVLGEDERDDHLVVGDEARRQVPDPEVGVARERIGERCTSRARPGAWCRARGRGRAGSRRSSTAPRRSPWPGGDGLLDHDHPFVLNQSNEPRARPRPRSSSPRSRSPPDTWRPGWGRPRRRSAFRRPHSCGSSGDREHVLPPVGAVLGVHQLVDERAGSAPGRPSIERGLSQRHRAGPARVRRAGGVRPACWAHRCRWSSVVDAFDAQGHAWPARRRRRPSGSSPPATESR